jgi:hypothetical protein
LRCIGQYLQVFLGSLLGNQEDQNVGYRLSIRRDARGKVMLQLHLPADEVR